MDIVLEIRKVSKTFGGVQALRGVEFSVNSKTVHALIGPNGAGKSTLINIITGVYQPTAGEVYFQKKRISHLPTHKIAQLGISRTFQLLELPQHLTVAENILIGVLGKNPPGFFKSSFTSWKYLLKDSEPWERVYKIAEFLGLEKRLPEVTQNLPIGEQRLVEIGRALATSPTLLLLDEPAAGLNTGESKRLGQLIRELVDSWGITVFLVEHDMDLVMQISDYITVLNFGEIILTSTPELVQRDERVHTAYFGEE